MEFLLRLIIAVIVVIVLLIFTFIFPVILYLLSLTPILGYIGVLANAIFVMIIFIMPVQPVTAEIIGYNVICEPIPNDPHFAGCESKRIMIVGNNSYALHVGDKFTLEASVYNPNWFSIDNYSTSTSFDRNAIVYRYNPCSALGEAFVFHSHESSEITIPNHNCEINIANSTGITNVTVQIQYTVDQKTYSVNASKAFTILPKT